MATKSEETDLPELLVKVEEELQVSQNGVKAIETLETLKSVENNPRFKVLLDDCVKLISEEQQTLEVILTIGTLYYNQSDYKTSIRWFLKNLTKLKLESEHESESESDNNKISYTTEYMLGCCFYNLNNTKMAYKCLKKCPPDPTNVSTYLKHCDMLIHSCQVLELHDEMLEYQGLNDENPSGILNVEVRMSNAKMLFEFGKIAGAKQHLKEATNILCNCRNKHTFWLKICSIYTEFEMCSEADQCQQKFNEAMNDKSLDYHPDIKLKALSRIVQDECWHERYESAISVSQTFLGMVKWAPHYDKHVVLMTMAESYFSLNDYGSAIKYFEESLEEMKKRRATNDNLDYCHLSRAWLRISRSQLLTGSYQMALKSAQKSENGLKRARGKFPCDDIDTAVQLSYCWRKMSNPKCLKKAKMFMNLAMELETMLEEQFVDMNCKDRQLRLVYMGVCEHLLSESGSFARTDNLFKLILLQEAEETNNSLEEVMKILNCCVKTGYSKRNNRVFPEDGQLFWSRIDHLCCNEADDDYFLSHLPKGFKKCFFRYKNSLEGSNHLFKQFN
jgi:tetratricopeptide (TPR) repeat protein